MEATMTQQVELKFEVIWNNNRTTQIPIMVSDTSIPALRRRAETIANYGGRPNKQLVPQMIRYGNEVLFTAGQPPIDDVKIPLDEDELPQSVEVSNDGGRTWECFDGPFYDQSETDAAMMAVKSAGYSLKGRMQYRVT